MATINPDLHHKFRNLTKLPSKEETGKEDIREDEEQSIKLQEIIDLLVAAGYFRARIKGLSSFDKIVGGMTWCIESCSVDVDVDLLFQENSTIGQKIALTEKIVAVLPKMKCPHTIEPHQIQGLDCVHIFPIIQWLVKRSMEVRQEMSEFVHSYAVNQFYKEFSFENKQLDVHNQIINNVNAVREVYRPRRFYKRKNVPPENIQSQVEITLLEYGIKANAFSIPSQENHSKHENSIEHDIDHLLNNLALMEQDNLENFELNDDERLELTKHYINLQMELQDGGTKSAEQKLIDEIKEQKQILIERCNKLKVKVSESENVIQEHSLIIENLKHKEQEAENALSKVIQEESTCSKDIKEVEDLVKLNDSLKLQESQFKESCKEELVKLKSLIEEKEMATSTSNNDEEYYKEIEEETGKMRILRLHLARRNRSIATIQRKLDEIPSQAELSQYQRRFLELYNQVASKHKETKQYYTLYNTLEDTRMYINKELSLLNSIYDSYPQALISNSNKEEFLKQFENIVESVKQTKMKVENKLTEERRKRDQLSLALQGLVEQQRRYVSAVKQLSVECRKQEMLLNQIKS